MNIQISDSWLREFIETKATPKQIGEYLSLCSQSVEKTTKDEEDFVYDIEITSNRPDCLSVYGIARELVAVLPKFGIETKLKKIPTLASQGFPLRFTLQVKISNPNLCPRFTALVFDNITIKPSPEFVRKRLKQSGIRALNNVIDISNYLMLELGQPMHTFDYDKILKHKMILRESKKGEEIVTLDGQKRILNEGVIIIEDGEGRIIDLCGIMGAKNSETDENTKRVLLFVQTYNPMKIRRACQMLAFRTEAASRFEKGIDPEGVISAMERATLLFKQWCGGEVASQLFDIYPHPAKPKIVTVTQQKIEKTMGINLPLPESAIILNSLGFETKIIENDQTIEALVPHWRNQDVEIAEDLVEEIARIYGYHNLPNILPPISTLDYQKEPTFAWEDKIKTALKYWGFTETMSYSLVGKELGLNPENQLKIANPLTEDLLYLRTSLIPSLLKIISQNQSGEEIKIFEIANIYFPKSKNELPQEIMTLTLATTGENKYSELRGILDALVKELGIDKPEIKPSECPTLNNYSIISIGETNIGVMGEVALSELTCFGIKQKVTILDLGLKKLLSLANNVKKYIPLPKYPAIIEDLTFIFPPRSYIGPVIEETKKTDAIIKSVELIDSYQNTKTFKVEYQSETQNLSDNEIKPIREKIIAILEEKFNAKLKLI